MKLNDKINQKIKLRKKRVRAKIRENTERPRLSVFRSNKHIYAQIISDESGRTVISASSRSLKKKEKPIELAREIGKLIAQKAIEAGIKAVVFDRGRYKYHGSVKALAEGARNGGLEF